MLNYDLFPANKYTKWYIALIDSRRFQTKQRSKTEAHHIFPKSIYGTNNILVNLTYREHYIAHLLLWNMFKENKNSPAYQKMTFAFNAMSLLSKSSESPRFTKINSTIFESVKIEVNRIFTLRMRDYWGNEENRNAQSERRKEHFKDEDNYNKMVETNRKLTSTPEWRKKRVTAQKKLHEDKEYTKLRIDAMHTPEALAKSAARNKARVAAMTPEERQKMYTRDRTPEQLAAHSAKLKGRKFMVHLKLKQRKYIQPSDIDQYLSAGWMLWSALSKEDKVRYQQG